MQKLMFEPAWDKTLDPRDRLEIERVFSEKDHEGKKGYPTTVLKTAKNYKGEFLVTVLLHNYENEFLPLRGILVEYEEKGKTPLKMESRYSLEVPAHTSMPWTFIFPKDETVSFENEKGTLRLIL